MSGLIESALSILSGCENRARIASENVSNMTTAGYKKRFAFTDLVRSDSTAPLPRAIVVPNYSQGPMRATDSPFDLAIQGRGFFVVSAANGSLSYTRQGQFQRAEDGRILTSGGLALQQEGGGDVVVHSQKIQIAADGTVLDGGQPVARIALVAPRGTDSLSPVGGSHFAAAESEMVEAPDASVRQGMLEGSNVSLGDEMLNLMTATRQAESGARLVQVYDELMGRALTALGQR